jgi:hypothetical protein
MPITVANNYDAKQVGQITLMFPVSGKVNYMDIWYIITHM